MQEYVYHIYVLIYSSLRMFTYGFVSNFSYFLNMAVYQ